MKNKDPLNESVVELFKKSTEQLISVIYEDFVAVSDATGMCIVSQSCCCYCCLLLGPSKQKKGSKFTTVAQTHKVSIYNKFVYLFTSIFTFVYLFTIRRRYQSS